MSTRILDPNSINKKKEDEAIAPSQPLSTPQGGAAAPLNASQAQQPQQAPSSGTFTDISKYKQAAQNAGNRIAQGVQSNFSRQSRQADASLKDTTNQFKRSMDSSSGYAASEEGRAGAIGNVANFAAKESGYNQPQQMPQRGIAPSQRQPQQEFTEKDFADVVNKEYTGVRRADEVDAYQQAQARAQAIRNYSGLLNDQNKKSDLMSATFGQNNNYTQGMNKLDSYLYGKSGAASAIKGSDQFKNAQGFDQRLDQTSTDLANQASTRAQQIAQMRDDARRSFTDVATGRTQQVDKRLDDVRNNWDSLANALRSEFYNPDRSVKTGVNEVSPLAMALLGVGEGSQLFNLTKDAEGVDNLIRSKEYERDRLISKQEQNNLGRLEALSRLAKSPGMEYNNKYIDANRAGTLTASDALDKENIANRLNEAMDKFKTDAQKDITTQGYANDRYKSGFKSRDIHEYRSATGSLDDVLGQTGYNYQQNLANANTSNSDIANVVNQLNEYKKTGDTEKLMSMLNTDIGNAILPALTGGASMLLPGSSLPGKEVMRGVWNPTTNLINDLGNKLGVLGDVTGLDALGSAMDSLGRRFGSDKNQKIAGAAARAQAQANERLQTALSNQLKDSGFYNTIKRGDTSNAEVQSRQQALMDLLSKLDATNRGNY